MGKDNDLVAELLGKLSPSEIRKACERANVSEISAYYWLKYDRSPRLSKFLEVARASGFDLVLVPRQQETQKMKSKTSKLKLITEPGGRVAVFEANKRIAYVEDDFLRVIGADGYAIEVGPVNHRSEIIGKLEAWRKNKNGGGSTPQAD